MFRSNRPRVRNCAPSLCCMPTCKVLLPATACYFLLKLFRKARRHIGFRLRTSGLKFQRLFCSLCFSYGFCLVSNKRQNRRLYIVFLDFLQHFTHLFLCFSFCRFCLGKIPFRKLARLFARSYLKGYYGSVTGKKVREGGVFLAFLQKSFFI